MTAATIIAVVLLLGTIAGLVQKSRRRRELLTRARDEWGRARPIEPVDDGSANEAWLALGEGAPNAALDDRTWSDLDLDRILAAVDHTRTGLGRQQLYRQLRTGRRWEASTTLEPISAQCAANPRFREALALPLSNAGPQLGRGLWRITQPNAVILRWWYAVFPLLAVLMIVAIVAAAFDPRAVLAVAALVVLNMGARLGASLQLPGLLTPMQQMGATITLAERLVGVPDLPTDTARAMQQCVSDLAPLRRIAWWVSRDPLSAGELAAGAWEYLNLLFLLDANALLLSARHLRRTRSQLRAVATWVGEVDLALSVASLRAEQRAWCRPAWTCERSVRMTGVWHPLLEAPVPNDCDLELGAGIVVTGANMSGKSTYLRAVGVAAVLARALDTCPASSWSGPLLHVRSLIGRNDDLASGKSYYQVEAEGVVEMLEHARSEERTLFLLDELLRGTNTVERLAAGEAVLRDLLYSANGVSNHAVIVATHDGELVGMLHELYTASHFRETVVGGLLHFDFIRRHGPSTTRTAIALLESAGASKSVVLMARNTAERLGGAAGVRTTR